MCGRLCDAVLELSGSATVLASLERSNLLLVPLDRRAEWYRYHHLFRDMLLAQLHRLEPGLIPALRRRAASWCLRNNLPEEALEYSIAAGDVDAVAGLVRKIAVPTHRQGRDTTVQRWFGWLDDRGAIDGHPMVAVLASLLSMVTARPADAERWAAWSIAGSTGTRRGPTTLLPRRGPPCCGPSCAAAGPSRCGPTPTRPCAGSRRSVSSPRHLRSCKGSRGSFPATSMAATCPSRTRSASRRKTGAPDDLAVALCERSLVAMACSDWSRAEVLAAHAQRFAPGRA